VEEAGYFKAYVGTSFDSHETGLDGSCTLRNPFGHGEVSKTQAEDGR
jgi:hypothetical protein